MAALLSIIVSIASFSQTTDALSLKHVGKQLDSYLSLAEK